MQAIPGLLIEYLFNGSLALAWLYPMYASYFSNVPEVLLLLLLVGLYVVGMVIDIVAWILTRPIKRWIRRPIHKKYRGNEDANAVSGTMRLAKITLHAPDLASELAMRSSRDRIARGAIINAILAAAFVLPWEWGVAAIIASIGTWATFEKLSYTYELCAEQVVDEKLRKKS